MKVWAMPVARPYNLERPPRGRADPGRLRQGRRQRRDRLLRVGRVSRALARRRTATARCILGWTGDNGDPDNFLAHPARLRRRRRQQPRAVVQRGVRRAGQRGQGDRPTRPSAPSSTSRRRSSSSARRRGRRSPTRWSSCRCARRSPAIVHEPARRSIASTASTSPSKPAPIARRPPGRSRIRRRGRVPAPIADEAAMLRFILGRLAVLIPTFIGVTHHRLRLHPPAARRSGAC